MKNEKQEASTKIVLTPTWKPNPTAPRLGHKVIPAFPGIQAFWTRVGARSLPGCTLTKLGEETGEGEEVALQPSCTSGPPSPSCSWFDWEENRNIYSL